MLILAGTTDTIEVVLAGAVTTNQLACTASWRDITTTAYTPGRTVINTNNTTAVVMVAAPAASTQRVVDMLHVYNADTASATVTIRYDANGTEYVLWSGVVQTGGSVSYHEGVGFVVNPSTSATGYAINVQALTSTPTDAQVVYFGTLPKAPITTANVSKVYIPRAGTIRSATVYCYSGTAGTAESWSLYLRLNNATDYLIETIAASANERSFRNEALAIPVTTSDYFEIKGVQPTWATNPATTIYGGYVYID